MHLLQLVRMYYLRIDASWWRICKRLQQEKRDGANQLIFLNQQPLTFEVKLTRRLPPGLFGAKTDTDAVWLIKRRADFSSCARQTQAPGAILRLSTAPLCPRQRSSSTLHSASYSMRSFKVGHGIPASSLVLQGRGLFMYYI
jgi:hypothetical protein